MERLLYQGADQFVLNKQQRSVLDVASEFGHSSVSSSYIVFTYLGLLYVIYSLINGFILRPIYLILIHLFHLNLYFHVVIAIVTWSIIIFTFSQPVGHCTFWISLSLRLSLSPKLGL